MKPARGALSRAAPATLATALLAAAVLLLLTWASAAGPDELLRGEGPPGTPRSDTVAPTPTQSPSATESDATADDAKNYATDPVNPWIGRVIAGVGGVGLALLGFVLLRRLYRAVRHRERESADPDEVDFEAITPMVAAREVVEDAVVQHRLLEEGTPRNGIVRCWDRLEQVAAGAGLARAEWETPAEFTLRFFDLLEADARPVQALATLYREARFSDHELSEADRETASAALAAIHHSLEARVS